MFKALDFVFGVGGMGWGGFLTKIKLLIAVNSPVGDQYQFLGQKKENSNTAGWGPYFQDGFMTIRNCSQNCKRNGGRAQIT